jgi:hypothetical protein
MRHFWFTLVLAALLALALPLAAGALSLDVEANGGGGLGLGSTNNPNETGYPLASFQGGIEADLFLVSLGPVDLGLSTGLEYDSMTNHGKVSNEPAPPPAPPGTLQTIDSDNTYNYLIVPFVITSRIPLSQSLNLSLRAGGFYGFFLGGKANNITSSLGGPSSSANLDSTNTTAALIGLHFSGGVDIRLAGSLFLSPSVIFNMGLTNTTGFPGEPFSQSNYTFYDSKTYSDSLWSLTLMIGLKYNVF